MSNFIIKGGVLTQYTGNGGKVTIPNDVKTIGARAFYKCAKLTEIEIPNKVTTIGDWAFRGCYNIKNIIAPAKFKDTLLKNLKGIKFTDNT